MRPKHSAKTVSAPKLVALVVASLIVASLAVAITLRQLNENPQNAKLAFVESLELADTVSERALGLSGRQNLADGSGMLFVFDEVGRQCMWMKDMAFPIDIIWLGDDRRINKIEENVSPDTYPESFCSANTKYVIELNAGIADRAGLKLGQIIDL